MIGIIIVALFAAYGFFCALWALFGWMIRAGKGAAAVCFCRPGLQEESVVCYYGWLRELGLFSGPLILADCGLSEEEMETLSRVPGVEICSPEALPARLELERDKLG